MAVTAKLYSKAPLNMAGGDAAGDGPMDLLSDTIKIALLLAHTEDQADEVFADVSTEQITGTGYTAGGATLGSKTYATSSLVTTFDAADPSWTVSTITTDGHVVYDDTPTTPADPLICYGDYGGSQSTVGTTFGVTLNVSGLFIFTVA